MVSESVKADLYKQGYRLVGNHSAIKVCLWTKKSIRKEDVCYKNAFYGIKSWQCIQMSPTFLCDHRCIFCWRNIEDVSLRWEGQIDNPRDIVEGCVKAQRGYLEGFRGNAKANKRRLWEAMQPLHFAISLTGEPCTYPRLPELISEIKKKKMTSFLVTNGTIPKMLKNLVKNQPTQLYITLPAPDEETYEKVCNPLIDDAWQRLMKSLSLMKKFKRNVLRLTLVKNYNLIKPEKYSELIKKNKPKFVELKSYMWVGHSRKRLQQQDMPLHSEIMGFAKEISKYSGY